MFEFIKKLFKAKEPKKPETFEEAVDYVAARIDPNTVNCPYFHFSGGMSIRNSLGLWNKESALYKHMQQRFGLGHADDTGTLITNAAHAKLNGLIYDPEPDVQRFKEHWVRFSVNPATMEHVVM